jgi:hypothetical protein
LARQFGQQNEIIARCNWSAVPSTSFIMCYVLQKGFKITLSLSLFDSQLVLLKAYVSVVRLIRYMPVVYHITNFVFSWCQVNDLRSPLYHRSRFIVSIENIKVQTHQIFQVACLL